MRHSSRNGPLRHAPSRDSGRTRPRSRRRRCRRRCRAPARTGDHVGHSLDVRMCRARRNSAKPLFSHTSTSGSRHSVARLTVSWMAGLNGAVAEEHDRDRVVAAQPCRKRAPEGDRHVAPHHSRRAHEAMLHVDEVHRPTEPPAQAVVASEQLGHRAVERRPQHDRVPVGWSQVRGRRREAASRPLRRFPPDPRSCGSGRGPRRRARAGRRPPRTAGSATSSASRAERLRAVERQPRHLQAVTSADPRPARNRRARAGTTGRTARLSSSRARLETVACA